MSLGKITSVGFDGNKFLNEDMISKLKKADEESLIKMPKQEFDKNALKQKDLTLLTTSLTKLQTRVKDLSDESVFLRRKVDTSGESATLTASPGVSLQSLKIDVTKLAQRDSYKSVNFKTKNDSLGLDKDTTLIMKIDGTSYEINLKKYYTLQDLADDINEKTNGEIQARLINVGGKDPYQMVIQSANTGEKKSIEFSEAGDSNLFEKLFGVKDKTQEMKDDPAKAVTNGGVTAAAQVPVKVNGKDVFKFNMESMRLTQASDAVFEYNGLSVTRSSNTITDLRVGLTLNLKKTGETSFEVQQENKDIKENLTSIVSAYNELMNNLTTMGDYNRETKKSGTFQGVSDVTSIRQKINDVLSYVMQRPKTEGEITQYAQKLKEKDNNYKDKSINDIIKDLKSDKNFLVKYVSIADFGLSINKNGLMEFDSEQFDKKISDDLKNGVNDIKDYFVMQEKHKQISTTTGEINSGELDFKSGDIIINGVSIVFKTQAGNNSEKNAEAFFEALGNADLGGLKFRYINGRVEFSRKDAFDIEIEGKSDKLAMLGLDQKKIPSKTERNSGIFTQLKDLMLDFMAQKEIGREDGSIIKYGEKLKKDGEDLQKKLENIKKEVSDKYDRMKQQFIRFDQSIQKVKLMWQPMQNMIDYELAKK